MTTTRHALLVGIRTYPMISDPRNEGLDADLKGCHNDVEKMRKVLLEARGFEAQHVRVLVDSKEALATAAAAAEVGGEPGRLEAQPKPSRLPTREGILSAMEGLLTEVEEGDIVLFYYSGHGSRVRNPRWPGKVFETLVPHDSGRGESENRDIFDFEIDLWIRRLDQRKVASTTLIFDSCHSGSVTRGSGMGDGGERFREVPPDDRPLEVMFQSRPAPDSFERPASVRSAVEGFEVRQNSGWLAGDRNAVVLAACGAEQLAREKTFPVRKEDGERFKFKPGVEWESRPYGMLTMFLGEELQNPEHQRWSQVAEAVHQKVQGEETLQQTHLEGDGPILAAGPADFTYRAPAASLELQRHALVIGIGAYHRHRGVAPLQTPVVDAGAVADLLEEGHGYHTVERLLDGEATLEAIVQRLRSLKRRLTPASALVLYFAGHGMAEGTLDLELEGYLWPVDADHQNRLSWLRMDAVMRELAGFRCRHLLVVLDCCFAGAFVASSRGAARSHKMFRSQFERAVRGQAWQLLASSAHNQLARDEDSTGTGHSPFANALLSGLGYNGARGTADLVDDGIVTATELFLHVEQALLNVPGQKPALRALSPLNEGEFIFLTQDRLELLDDPQLEEGENPWRGAEVYAEKEGGTSLSGRGLDSALKPEVTEVSEVNGIAGPGDVFGHPTPPRDELREAILGPAESRFLFFESERMVEDLLDGFVDSPAPLILLSLTLAEVYRQAWRRQQETGKIDRELKRVDLRAVGGIGGVLAKRAETVYERASRTSKKTLRRLILRLVPLEGNGESSSREVDRQQLEDWRTRPWNEQKRVQAALHELLTERILILDHGRLQLTSDRMVFAWGRLRGWMEESGEQEFQQGLRLLGPAAVHWREANDFTLLWNDRHPRVVDVSKRPDDLNRTEQLFVDACQRQRKISHKLWAAVCLMVAVCGLVLFLYQGSERARRVLLVHTLAIEAVEEVKTNRKLGLLLAVQAVEISRKVGNEHLAQAEEALRTVLDHSESLLGHRMEELIPIACDAAGRNFTEQEWKEFVPGERYRPPC